MTTRRFGPREELIRSLDLALRARARAGIAAVDHLVAAHAARAVDAASKGEPAPEIDPETVFVVVKLILIGNQA